VPDVYNDGKKTNPVLVGIFGQTIGNENIGMKCFIFRVERP
jgi:hypothetical protein